LRKSGRHCLHQESEEGLLLGGEKELEAWNHGRADGTAPCRLLIHLSLLAYLLLENRRRSFMHARTCAGFIVSVETGNGGWVGFQVVVRDGRVGRG